MTEQTIQRAIIDYLTKEGAYVVKVITASKKGVPDLLACYKGHFVGIEVKKPTTKANASELQLYNIKKIHEAGGLAIVAWDVKGVESALATLQI